MTFPQLLCLDGAEGIADIIPVPLNESLDINRGIYKPELRQNKSFSRI